MSTPSPLKIRDLAVGYKTPLFTGLNLELQPQQFVTLMGENGSGKTTLIEVLMGLKKPDQGVLEFWGKPLNGSTRKEINNRTGWVTSQRENYPPWVKINDFLDTLRLTYNSWNVELAKTLLERFALDPNKYLTQLSLGENSKIKLLKALAFEPQLLILDELTANLSEGSKAAVLETLIDLLSNKAISILYICHSNEEALRLSDRVLILEPTGLKEKL